MKCFVCGRECGVGKVLLNQDGDFACSSSCRDNYEKEKSRFFGEIIHNDAKFANWMNE